LSVTDWRLRRWRLWFLALMTATRHLLSECVGSMLMCVFVCQDVFNDSKVTITGLNPVTQYRFKVFAENGVTKLVGESDFVDITVTTEASVTSSVTNVRVTSVKSTELSLAWDPPLKNDATDNEGDVVEQYEVSNSQVSAATKTLRKVGTGTTR